MEQRPGWQEAETAHPPAQGDDDFERPLYRALTQVGVDEKPARVVAHLVQHGSARSTELEDACDMRQPEVSQTTIDLRDRGWVVATREKRGGKGRPVNHYHLRLALKEIVHEVEAHERERINQALARLEHLRELAERIDHTPDPP
ncbi:MAG: helix-turn-helix domain-containing protein [Candidatus Thermoplasmatota archaeon]|nr:helix-turn-helix domain-containing protein [Candidatus Thermoplasmatota archaeon]